MQFKLTVSYKFDVLGMTKHVELGSVSFEDADEVLEGLQKVFRDERDSLRPGSVVTVEALA